MSHSTHSHSDPHTDSGTKKISPLLSKQLKPKYRVIALTGPQGSGKTTQLKLILDKIDAEFASVGDILRSILPYSDKPEHIHAREMMYSGVLIPDELTFEILKDYFKKKQENGETKEVLFFDGFPRTVLQTEHLYELARIYHGYDADLLPPIAIARMTLEHGHAKKRCLDRAESLQKAGKEARVDDTDEAISKRLGIYFDSVPHLNKAFEGKAHLHEFEGNREAHEVHADMLERLFHTE